MGHTVTGKLKKNASIFQAGDSTGFGIGIGVKYYDRDTQKDQWTNYKAAIFSKNQNQINFLTNALVEGAIVELSGDTIKIDRFQSDNGTEYLTLVLNNAKLGYIGTPGNQQQQPVQNNQGYAPQQQYQQQPQQQGYNPQQQGYAPQQNQGYNSGNQ